MEITTERLFLRTVTQEDAATVREFGKDEFATEEDALRWIRWVRDENEKGRLLVIFYIWLKGTGRCVGRVYLHSKPELESEIEIGYGIAEEFRKNGYATEAARAAVGYAFGTANLDRLTAIVKPDNIASLRTVEKLGFSRRAVRVVPDENGVNCDFYVFLKER